MKRILFLELSNPSKKSVGGSFFSLQAMLELFPELRNRANVAFYFENKIAQSLIEKGFDVRFLKYHKSGVLTFFVKWIKSVFFSKRSSMVMPSLSKHPVVNENIKYSKFEIIWQYYVAIYNAIGICLLIKKTKTDIVYCNCGINIDRAGIIAALILKKRVCCHLRNMPKLTLVDRLLARRVDYFVAISRAVSLHYKRELLDNNIPISIIINPVGRSFGNKPTNCMPKNFKKSYTVISCFSRMLYWKGQEVLIDSFNELLQKNRNALLLIYGQGEESKRLKMMVEKLNISDKVLFKGFVNDIESEMLAADIIVNPSTSPEPLGRTIMEGMSLGRTVVATNIGGAVELINDGFNGYLVRPNSVEDLSNILLYLCKDPQKRIEVGIRAKEKSIEQWNSRIVKNNYSEVFKYLDIIKT